MTRVFECLDCGALIFDNDSALICIQCGGRNRRVPHDPMLWVVEVIAIASVVAFAVFVVWTLMKVFL